MLIVRTETRTHLILAVRSEIEHLTDIHRVVGADWPTDFDSNDISLYEAVLEALTDPEQNSAENIDIGSGKSTWFLTTLLLKYVLKNMDNISLSDFNALRKIYFQLPLPHEPFPER